MIQRPLNQASFDTHADTYDEECMQGLSLSGESREYFARGRLALLQRWWSETQRAVPDAVIDYGCGTGEVTALLSNLFPESRIVGLDPSAKSIDRADVRHGSNRVRFYVLDDRQVLPRAQLIHVNGVVHHVAPKDRRTLIDHISERLDKGDALALFENNPLNPGTRLVMSRIPFDRDALPVPPWEARRRIREAGLTIAEHRYLFYFPHALRVLRSIEPWLERVPLGAQYGIFATRD